MSGATLRVAIGDEAVGSEGDPITFGRQADLIIDESNRFLHRVVGRFVCREGLWWVQNHSSRGSLTLESLDTASRLDLGVGGQFPVPGGSFLVAFGAGKANYELECWAMAPNELRVAWDAASALGDGTLEFGRIPLTSEQHLLCIALAESRLLGHMVIPSNVETAARLGWSITKFNRKLDYVCGKFATAGVRGLRGDRVDLAADRRRVLVDHVIKQQLVSIDDLGLLGDHAATRAVV